MQNSHKGTMGASLKQIGLSYTDGGDYTYTRTVRQPNRNRLPRPTPRNFSEVAPKLLAFWFRHTTDSDSWVMH